MKPDSKYIIETNKLSYIGFKFKCEKINSIEINKNVFLNSIFI